jgi:hypothetical protein
MVAETSAVLAGTPMTATIVGHWPAVLSTL